VMPTQTTLTFTAKVDPKSASRTVRIEQSSDKVRWVPVGLSALTNADGTSVVKVPSPGVGVWSYRATVAKDDTFAAAVSPVVGATVEDIKAAGASYLRITNEFNVAVRTYNKLFVGRSTAQSVPASWRSASQVMSVAETKAAAQLRAYGAWPQSVKPQMDQIIAQYVIAADSLHQLSAITTWDSWTTEDAKQYAAGVEGGRLSTLIRQALGLPQRSTS